MSIEVKFRNGNVREFNDFDEFGLSNKIISLDISYYKFNNLNSLPDLSLLKNLKELICSNCNLKELKGINKLKNLKYLICDNNKIEELPDLSNTKLKYIDCSNNNLQYLPKLPFTVKELYCDNNKLIEINISNLKLIQFEFNGNDIEILNDFDKFLKKIYLISN